MRVGVLGLVALLLAAGCASRTLESSAPPLTTGAKESNSCHWMLPDGNLSVCPEEVRQSGVDVQTRVPPSMLCMIGYDLRPLEAAVGWWHGPASPDGANPALQQGLEFHVPGEKALMGFLVDLRNPNLPRFAWPYAPRNGFVQLPISGDGKDLELGGLLYEQPVFTFNRSVDSANLWWQAYRFDGVASGSRHSYEWHFEPALAVRWHGHTEFFRGSKERTISIGSDHSGNAQGPWIAPWMKEIRIDALSPDLAGNVTVTGNTFYGWLDDARDPFWTTGCPK